jgi:parallel beta-helix repeat protein
MKKFMRALLGAGLVIASGVVFAVAPAGATDISGTISTTMTIFDNSRLIANATCMVTPCIKFGASNIRLDLNGFVLAGGVPGSTGIDTNGQTHVDINGPGVVRVFSTGILVNGGSNNSVEGVTVSACADDGIALVGTSNNEIEGNTIVGDFAATFGIVLSASNSANTTNNRVRRNEIVRFAFGIKLAGIVTGNLFEENAVLGNDSGGISIQVGGTGNLFRRNQVFDNGFGNGGASDIFDANAAGANAYRSNLCYTSAGTGAANVCPSVPDITGHRND